MTDTSFFFCAIAISPLRAEKSDKSEMVSQLLFGELVEVLEVTQQWRKIKSLEDGYIGWTDEKSLNPIAFDSISVWRKKRVKIYCNSFTILENGEEINLPKGAYVSSEEQFSIGNYTYNSLVPVKSQEYTIQSVSRSYLNSPYLWGGRSIFGIDCSGFTQEVFGFLGKQLPRDANQQELVGQVVEFEKKEIGDLAFFKNSENKITHVGILLENNSIIHAHGKVRIDVLNEEGIFNVSNQKITHQLANIKRY